MLDIKLLRKNPNAVKEKLSLRSSTYTGLVDNLLDLDTKRRQLISELEGLRADKNRLSKRIGLLFREGKKPEAENLRSQLKTIEPRIEILKTNLLNVDSAFNRMLLSIPNLPNDDVPIGSDETQNVPVRYWGTKKKFSFRPLPHYDIAEKLGILDFKRAAKISGSRFVVYKGWGARLERALINFMLDVHVSKHGYREIIPPFLVNSKTMTGTGQLPKFMDDL
ncbi:MAG: serine--tRNA ligase, partial [Nitrospiraceae bacterium]|nr:serine--tRNA ligase [Nitrospiraceae bacterium]